MNRTILLVTTVTWPSVPRYAAGFAAAGARVEVFAPPTAPVNLSRYVARAHPYRPLAPLASLKKAIARANADLLVPCDDRAVSLLLKLHADADANLASLIARSLGNPSSYAMMMSRSQSLAAMRAVGVRLPDTYPVGNEDELDRLLTETGFPAVFKVDGSWGGDGIAIVGDPKEAIRVFRRLARPVSRLRNLARSFKRRDLHFLREVIAPTARLVSLQRFVAGKPAASAFAAWQGKLMSVFCYEVLVAQGTIGPPNVIRRLHCPEMVEASRLAAERFGLSGLFGMDFIRDAEGKPYLIEINPRGTQGGTLPFGLGCDLPVALSESAFGCARSCRPTITKDVVVTFPRLWLNDPQSVWLKIGYHDVPWDDPPVLAAALAGMKSPALESLRHVYA